MYRLFLKICLSFIDAVALFFYSVEELEEMDKEFEREIEVIKQRRKDETDNIQT
jgi:hypothetical protein